MSTLIDLDAAVGADHHQRIIISGSGVGVARRPTGVARTARCWNQRSIARMKRLLLRSTRTAGGLRIDNASITAELLCQARLAACLKNIPALEINLT
jgi:hypothetical protein